MANCEPSMSSRAREAVREAGCMNDQMMLPHDPHVVGIPVPVGGGAGDRHNGGPVSPRQAVVERKPARDIAARETRPQVREGEARLSHSER